MSTLLDASLFNSPLGDQGRVTYTESLVRCLVDHGYVRLQNHGIPDELIEEAFDWVGPNQRRTT